MSGKCGSLASTTSNVFQKFSSDERILVKKTVVIIKTAEREIPNRNRNSRTPVRSRSGTVAT